jgi:hypothetical protein
VSRAFLSAAIFAAFTAFSLLSSKGLPPSETKVKIEKYHAKNN